MKSPGLARNKHESQVKTQLVRLLRWVYVDGFMISKMSAGLRVRLLPREDSANINLGKSPNICLCFSSSHNKQTQPSHQFSFTAGQIEHITTMYLASTVPVLFALLPLAASVPAPQDINRPSSLAPRDTPTTTSIEPIQTGATCGEYWPVAVKANVAVQRRPIIAGYADNPDQSLSTCQNLVEGQAGDAAPTPLPSNVQDLTLGGNLMFGFFIKPECTHCKIYSYVLSLQFFKSFHWQEFTGVD
jgi:hypothetical protein